MESGRLARIAGDQIHLRILAEQVAQVGEQSLDQPPRSAFDQQDPRAGRDVRIEEVAQTAILPGCATTRLSRDDAGSLSGHGAGSRPGDILPPSLHRLSWTFGVLVSERC